MNVNENDRTEISSYVFCYQCPLDWNNLDGTINKEIRFCHTCKKNVYYVETQAQLDAVSKLGSCVAFTPPNVRFINGKLVYDEPLIKMGMLITPAPEDAPELTPIPLPSAYTPPPPPIICSKCRQSVKYPEYDRDRRNRIICRNCGLAEAPGKQKYWWQFWK